MKQKSILLIWEEIPEETKMFWLTDLTQEQYDKICAAHGTYINCNENDATVWLSEFLCKKQVQDKKPMEIDRRCTVVISGFYM